jgi:hypothetical protein
MLRIDQGSDFLKEFRVIVRQKNAFSFQDRQPFPLQGRNCDRRLGAQCITRSHTRV